MKMRVRKAFKGACHVGWKKTVGGTSWFLGYGTAVANDFGVDPEGNGQDNGGGRRLAAAVGGNALHILVRDLPAY